MEKINSDCLCLVETKIALAHGNPTSGRISSLFVLPDLIFAWRDGLEFDLVLLHRFIISIMVYDDPNRQP